MQADPKVLRQRVFRCEECSESGFGFSRIDADAALSKFPPTIGSSGDAPLLFIGTNPRISNSNRELYTEIMRSPESFDLLAQDVWRGRSYLRFGEPGHHYDLHIAIARKAIPGRPFASVAAVTEVFLCATLDGGLLPNAGSRCADLHLDEVAQQVRPQVVVAVGAKARDYLARRRLCTGIPFRVQLGEGIVVVAPVPHPAAWGARSGVNAYINWAAEVIQTATKGSADFPPPPRDSGRPFTQRQLAGWLIRSNPNISAGDLTARLASAFPPPAYKVGLRHGPHYLSLYRTGKLDVPDSDPRDW